MTKLIVILGITGTQGASVASTFLHEPSWTIRGITRDPSKPSARALAAKGVQIAQGDLNDPASLLAAFDGATAIFAVTDFWAGFADPANPAKAAQARQAINEYAFAIEVRQGMNAAEAAAAPATLRTLERFVFSALSDVRKWSGGKYTWVYHFDAKARVVALVKERYPELEQRMSTLQMGEYVTNWKQFAGLGPRKLPDGSYLLVKPCPGDVPIPMVYTANDTGSFVKALVQSPPGTNLLGYGSLIGWSEYMRLWTSVLKVSGRFEQIPIETYMDKAPVNLAKEIQEAYAYQAEFGWDGGDPSIVHPKDLLVDVPTTSVEEYIRGEDWSSVLEAQST